MDFVYKAMHTRISPLENIFNSEMDKNKELNIKLKQVPSSYHENDNRVMNNSELLSLWNLIARVRESRAEVKIKAKTKY